MWRFKLLREKFIVIIWILTKNGYRIITDYSRSRERNVPKTKRQSHCIYFWLRYAFAIRKITLAKLYLLKSIYLNIEINFLFNSKFDFIVNNSARLKYFEVIMPRANIIYKVLTHARILAN